MDGHGLEPCTHVVPTLVYPCHTVHNFYLKPRNVGYACQRPGTSQKGGCRFTLQICQTRKEGTFDRRVLENTEYIKRILVPYLSSDIILHLFGCNVNTIYTFFVSF